MINATYNNRLAKFGYTQLKTNLWVINPTEIGLFWIFSEWGRADFPLYIKTAGNKYHWSTKHKILRIWLEMDWHLCIVIYRYLLPAFEQLESWVSHYRKKVKQVLYDTLQACMTIISCVLHDYVENWVMLLYLEAQLLGLLLVDLVLVLVGRTVCNLPFSTLF